VPCSRSSLPAFAHSRYARIDCFLPSHRFERHIHAAVGPRHHFLRQGSAGQVQRLVRSQLACQLQPRGVDISNHHLRASRSASCLHR
jgi:hypothetical protein